jgi:nuclear pore complex protein Nup53
MDEDEVVAAPGAGALVPTTVTVGTPLKLAPSAAAFRKPGTGPAVGSVAPMPGGNPLAPTTNTSGVQQPGKGVFGQVSDLIFGW